MKRETPFFLPRGLGFVVAACLAIATTATGDDLRLSLGETLRRVEAENLQVLVNREVVEQAMAAAQRQRAPLFPQLSLDASQVRNQSVNTGLGFAAWGGIPLQPPPSNRFDARLVASVPLIDPTLIASYRSARLGVKLSEHEEERVRQEVLNTAAGIYLTHLRNLRRFDVIAANIERGRALLRLAQDQLDAGVATRIDVTRAEVQVAVDEQARLQQETVVYQSELFLKRLLNLDLRRPVVLADFRASRYLPGDEPDVDFDEVLADRPEYRRARTQLEQNRLERRAAGWERFPALRAFGDYGFVSGEPFDGGERRAWTAGVAASMPIFEGFRIDSNKRLASSRIRATELEIQQIEQNVSSELLMAWQDMRSRLAQISVSEQNLGLAEEEIRLARIRFEQGVADNREIIDAQNRLAVAHDNYVEAVHQYNLSRLEYARSKGEVRLILADQEVVRE
jgi:outer membrane protein